MNDEQLHRVARAIARKLATPPSEETQAKHLDAVTKAVRDSDTPTVMPPWQRLKVGVAGPNAAKRLAPAVAAAGLIVAIIVTPLVNSPNSTLPMLSATPGEATPNQAGSDALMERGDAAPDIAWWPMNYRFELADSVNMPAATAPAWRMQIDASAQQYANTLSAIFDLPSSTPSEWDPQARVAGDEQQRSVTLYPTGEWYYANFTAYPQWSCPDSRAEIPPDQGVSSEPGTAAGREPAVFDDPCTPPPAAENLPSPAAARQQADALFARLGITDIRFEEPHRDEWTVSLWGTQQFAELPGYTGQGVSVTFGANSEILGAYGSFARPVLLGEYPTVSATEAVQRLNASFTDQGGVARPLPAPLVDGDAPVSDENDADAAHRETETVVVTLVSVTIVPSIIWSPDGFVVIAPHYRFVDTHNQEWWVVAVTDRYLAG